MKGVKLTCLLLVLSSAALLLIQSYGIDGEHPRPNVGEGFDSLMASAFREEPVDRRQALRYANDALRMSPKDSRATVLRFIGRQEFHLGNSRRALTAYAQAIEDAALNVGPQSEEFLLVLQESAQVFSSGEDSRLAVEVLEHPSYLLAQNTSTGYQQSVRLEGVGDRFQDWNGQEAVGAYILSLRSLGDAALTSEGDALARRVRAKIESIGKSPPERLLIPGL